MCACNSSLKVYIPSWWLWNFIKEDYRFRNIQIVDFQHIVFV